jgi:hypothetical protein
VPNQIRNIVIKNELIALNLNNIIFNLGPNWIHGVERIEPKRIPKQRMEHATRGTISVTAGSYAENLSINICVCACVRACVRARAR